MFMVHVFCPVFSCCLILLLSSVFSLYSRSTAHPVCLLTSCYAQPCFTLPMAHQLSSQLSCRQPTFKPQPCQPQAHTLPCSTSSMAHQLSIQFPLSSTMLLSHTFLPNPTFNKKTFNLLSCICLCSASGSPNSRCSNRWWKGKTP